MTRPLEIDRADAEYLIELIEKDDPKDARHATLAADLRVQWGLPTKERALEVWVNTPKDDCDGKS